MRRNRCKPTTKWLLIAIAHAHFTWTVLPGSAAALEFESPASAVAPATGFPSLACAPAGECILVYTEPALAVRAVRSTDGGQTWTSSSAVSPAGLQHHSPQVVHDGAGRWLAVWSLTSVGCGENVVFSSSTDGGLTWTVPTEIDPGCKGTNRYARIAVDGAGNVVVGWLRLVSNELYLARSGDHGATWSVLPPMGTMAEEVAFSLATDRTGTWIAAGSKPAFAGSDLDIVAFRSTDAGVTWSAPTAINSNAAADVGLDFQVTLASAGSGRWLAAWSSSTDLVRGGQRDDDIHVAISNDGGSTWSPPTAVDSAASTDSDSDQDPKVSVDEAGSWLVVWSADAVVHGYQCCESVLRYAYSADGTTWSPATRLDPTNGEVDRYASVAASSEGWLVAWRRDDDVMQYALSTVCGDGRARASEACDDGDLVSGDGCDENCQVTACGNGIATVGEECDDGGFVSGDGCDANCRLTACGNGIRTGDEACDDGNAIPGDGCESTCVYTTVSQIVAAGGSVTSDILGAGATAEAPLAAALTTPNEGTVTIGTAITLETSSDVEVLGLPIEVSAPPATPNDPIVLVLEVDAALVPPGVALERLDVIRNGALVADCTGAPGVASPDPCVATRAVQMDDDVEITVLTSRASEWAVVLRGLFNAEQSCVKAVAKVGWKVAKVQAKLNGQCLAAAAAGEVPDAADCIAADSDQKVAATLGKLEETELKKCALAPPFGIEAAASVGTAAQQGAIDLVTDLFGADLPVAIVAKGDARARCQSIAWAKSYSLVHAQAKIFAGCLKGRLAGKPSLIVKTEDIEACLVDVASDAKGKVAKAREKLAASLEACANDVGTVLPGGCGATFAPAECLSDRSACRFCRMTEAFHGMSVDCDAYDDDAANGSCL